MKQNINKLLLITIVLCSWAVQAAAQDEQKREAPKANIVKVNIGPSMVVSKVIFPVYGLTNSGGGVVGDLKMKNLKGVDAGVTYQHLWRIGIGVGVDYNFSKIWLTSEYGHFIQQYIGPSFVYTYRGWKHFGLGVAVGIGYVHVYEEFYTPMEPWPGIEPLPAMGYKNRVHENGLGNLTRLSAEYRFNAHFGIGADFNLFNTQFHFIKNLDEAETLYDNITRLNLLISANFYF